MKSHFFGALLALSLAFSQVSYGYDFGRPGRNGRDGFNGVPGKDGTSTVIRATGQAVALNLSGTPGGPGESGERGEDAWACTQPRPDRDVRGADGGDGGNGGIGGRGGNGGDVTIFTNNVANLKSVLIQSVGAQSGYSGVPGGAGRGCYCTFHQWNIPFCKIVKNPQGQPVKVCENRFYRCYDGSYGRPGNPVPTFPHGTPGHLTLIKQLEDLEPVTPTITIPMSQLMSGPFMLSDNVWMEKMGANSLLAGGSYMEDRYTEFSHRQEFPYAFGWEARKPLSDFYMLNLQMAASTANNRVYVYVPSDVWYQAREVLSEDAIPHMIFEKVLFAKDSNQLSMAFSGREGSFAAEVTDLADVSDLVNSTFEAKLEKDGFFGNKDLFKGMVPAEYVKLEGNKFTIQFGQIPGVDHKYLEKGKKIKLELKVRRSLGKFASQKDFDKDHKIP